MRLDKALIAAASVAATAVCSSANAYESGYSGSAQKPGVTLGGGSAGVPPPGLYMFNQAFTYQANIVGPGAPNVGGRSTPVHAAVDSVGLLWVPGWTFLGATYDAVLVQPWIMADLGSPVNSDPAGVHNTFIVPAELSWKLGDSGFFVKAGLGVYVPDGSITGPAGLGNVGNPWWTFQPELIVSYLKDGWNLTANVFEEINTRNTITEYRTGDILHAEFTATKTIGKWTAGPVAYYVGQVTNDTSSRCSCWLRFRTRRTQRLGNRGILSACVRRHSNRVWFGFCVHHQRLLGFRKRELSTVGTRRARSHTKEADLSQVRYVAKRRPGSIKGRLGSKASYVPPEQQSPRSRYRAPRARSM